MDAEPGDADTEQGIAEAGKEEFFGRMTGNGETDENLDSDEEGGMAVAFCAEMEKERDGEGLQGEESDGAGGEDGNECADEDAGYGAADALAYFALRGGVVGLDDEDGGEQYPVADRQVQGFDGEGAGEGEDGGAQGVAAIGGLQGEVLREGTQGFVKAGDTRHGETGVWGRIVGVIFAGEAVELGVDAGKVGDDAFDVGCGSGTLLPGVLQAGEGAVKNRVVTVRIFLQECACHTSTGAALQTDEAGDAEDGVAVGKGGSEFAVVGVAGADAFVDILGNEVVAQLALAARLQGLSAKANKESVAALVESGDDVLAFVGETGLGFVEVVAFVGIEEGSFGGDIVGQCTIGGSEGSLHRTLRVEEMEDKGAELVDEGAGDEEQSVQRPGDVLLLAQDGVEGNGECAECEGAVAPVEGAEEGSGKGDGGHHRDHRPGMAACELYGDGGGGEGDEHKEEVLQAAADAVIHVGEATGDDAEHEGDAVVGAFEKADSEGDENAGDKDGQGGKDAVVHEGATHHGALSSMSCATAASASHCAASRRAARACACGPSKPSSVQRRICGREEMLRSG